MAVVCRFLSFRPVIRRCVAVSPGLSNPNPLTPRAAAHTIAAK